MTKSLIIKRGAIGDVVRTTPLLRLLSDHEAWWVTAAPCDSLLPRNAPNLGRVLVDDEAGRRLKGERFDLVLSLDDDLLGAELASRVSSGTVLGAYLRDGHVTYTDSAEPWFGMGLLSKQGRAWADQAKRTNTRTYQEILFGMLGSVFRGEEYWIEYPRLRAVSGLVGLERRAGGRWPTKCWNKYDVLADLLEAKGYRVRFFEQRGTLGEYLADIGECEHIVCGDTLAMHLALAMFRTVTAIFTCTPPQEIHSYGRLEKIVSPQIDSALYRTDYVRDAVEAVPVDLVLESVMRSLKSPPAGRALEPAGRTSFGGRY